MFFININNSEFVGYPGALSLTLSPDSNNDIVDYKTINNGVSIEEFVEIIDTYIHWYNEKRIKQSLGFLSPYEYRKIQGYT